MTEMNTTLPNTSATHANGQTNGHMASTPPPPVVDMGAQKCASMSQQHCRLVLTPLTMLPGHGSGFLCLPCRRHTGVSPPTQCNQPHQFRGTASTKMRKGQGPQMWFLLFEASQCCGVRWNEQRGSQSPLCCEGLATKHENNAGVVRQCFGTSWRHCVHICARSQSCQPPGSPLRLPGVS